VRAPFSAWREGAVYYVPVLTAGFLLFLLLRSFGGPAGLSAPVLVLGLGVLAFFRDPPRRVQAQPNELVSPADGRIVGIEDLAHTPHYDGPCRRVSIFLSILSVHVNRAPFNGTVRKIEYTPGRFKNAMKAESSETNEANTLWIETAHGPITVRQISGAVARRIVCNAAEGEILAKGEKFGMIKFGSRTELYVPPDTEVCIDMKAAARAGVTVLARFRQTE